MATELNAKASKAVAWSSFAEILSKLITPIVNIVLARLLVPEAFGAVATITMVISFAEIFTDAGFQKYIIQHNFESDESLEQNTNVAFWTNFVFSCVIVGIIVLFRTPIAKLVGSQNLGDGIAVAALSIIALAFSSIQMARFKRDLDFKSLFFVRIIGSFIPLIVTVPLAFALRSYWALIIGTIAVNLFNAIAFSVKSKWRPRFYYSFTQLKEMFSFSAWSMVESVVIWLTNNLDIFIVGTLLSQYYLGIYKTAMSTVNSYMGIITAAVAPVLFSTLSRYQNNAEEFKNTFWRFQKLTGILVLPMSVGLFIFRDIVTFVLLGSQWEEASAFIGLWGLMSGIAIIFANYSSEVYRGKGNPQLSTLAQLLHIAFMVPAVLLASKHGYDVLYFVRSLVRLQFIIVHLIIMRVVYKFKIINMLKNNAPALISSVLMGALGWLLNAFNTSWWWQIISIVICIVFYFAVLFLFFPKTRKELSSIPIIKK